MIISLTVMMLMDGRIIADDSTLIDINLSFFVSTEDEC